MKLKRSLQAILVLMMMTNLAHALVDAEKASDSEASKNDAVLNSEIDANKLKKEFVSGNPTFSTRSADQDKSDEAIKRAQEQAEDATINHVLSLDECGKKYEVEEIQKCKRERFKLKK